MRKKSSESRRGAATFFAWAAFFASAATLLYAVRAIDRQNEKIEDLNAEVARLMTSISDLESARPQSRRSPRETARRRAETQAGLPAPDPARWEDLPEWVAEDYSLDLEEIALAVPRDDGTVDALRMLGPEGRIRALEGEQLVKAERLLELLVDYRRMRQEYLDDMIATQTFDHFFDTIEEAKKFAKVNMHYAIEPTDDERYGLIDLRPFNESDSVAVNEEQRETLATDLDARLATLVSFERKNR